MNFINIYKTVKLKLMKNLYNYVIKKFSSEFSFQLRKSIKNKDKKLKELTKIIKQRQLLQ